MSENDNLLFFPFIIKPYGESFMLVPALHFSGNCAEVIEFYKKVFRAEVLNISYYRDAPQNSGMNIAEEILNKVMHAELNICGSRINMCDVQEKIAHSNMFLFNIFLESIEEVTDIFHKLKEGGKILTDLSPTFWAPMYGEIIDRYRIVWHLMVQY